jgi:lysozyme
MSYRDIARKDLINDEALKLKLYKCTAGKWTIGVGRNLEDRGITKEEAMVLLENDLALAEKDARALFPNFDALTDNRRAVLINMSFNLGLSRLAGFKKFRKAVEAGDYPTAAAEMTHSVWALQVGRRAERLSNLMKAG